MVSWVKDFVSRFFQRNSLVRQSSLNVFGKVLTAAISLGFIKYFSKQFTVEEMGAYAVLDISMTFLAMFANFGLNQSLVRFIPEYLKNNDLVGVKKLLSTFISFTLLVNLMLAGVIFLFRGQISTIFFGSADWSGFILMILVYVFINFYTNGIILSYQGLGDFAKVAFFNFFNIFLQRALAVLLIVNGWGLEGVFIGFISGSVIAMIVSSIPLVKYIIPFHLDLSLVRKGLPYYLEGFTRYGYGQADAFIVALLFDPKTLGGFFIVNRIVYVFRLILDSFLEPVINRLIRSTDSQYSALFKKTFLLVLSLCFCVVGMFYLFGDVIFSIVSDTAYSGFGDLLVIYGISALILYYTYSMIGIHVLIKFKPKYIFYLGVLLSISILALEFIFGYHFGVIGIPAGQAAGFILFFGIVFWFYKSFLRQK